VLVTSCRCLDVSLFEKIQDYKDEDFSAAARERGKCFLTILNLCLSHSSSHYGIHALI
jgi:hypothetical protein